MEHRLNRRVPLGRVGDPETDVGRAVAFLVGPDEELLEVLARSRAEAPAVAGRRGE